MLPPSDWKDETFFDALKNVLSNCNNAEYLFLGGDFN